MDDRLPWRREAPGRQNPAYRPTRPPHTALTCGGAALLIGPTSPSGTNLARPHGGAAGEGSDGTLTAPQVEGLPALPAAPDPGSRPGPGVTHGRCCGSSARSAGSAVATS